MGAWDRLFRDFLPSRIVFTTFGSSVEERCNAGLHLRCSARVQAKSKTQAVKRIRCVNAVSRATIWDWCERLLAYQTSAIR